ncbi:MAG: hypothetical protein AB7W37_08105 [Syntrophobacteraceae bacterium]
MDRASRFLWELRCGRKDRKLLRRELDVHRVVYNFSLPHYTTKQVAAVSLGISAPTDAKQLFNFCR